MHTKPSLRPLTHTHAVQLLLLWDRIIGFDSLEPLPLLAAAIFAFRAAALHGATDAGAARAVLLSDASQLRVVPLLQAVSCRSRDA